MKQHKENLHEPLLHVSKRMDISQGKAWAIRIAAGILAFLVCAAISSIFTKSYGGFFTSLWNGTFKMDLSTGATTRFWTMIEQLSILLCISLALTPAFKMRFWNIGGEGQTLISCLVCAACMFYLRKSVSNSLLLIIMLVVGVAAGIVWALIPALCKAKWNTNETLFTLMMNYIAMCLVTFFISYAVKTGSGVLGLLPDGHLPMLKIPGLSVEGQKYLLLPLVVAVLTGIMYAYLKYSKHGYEISVVGESVNTARYVGINVKKVIIRTMIFSGALCGFAGWLLTTGATHTVNTGVVGGDGFTAILVAWLSHFNPLAMVFTAFLVVFLRQGASQLDSDYKLNNSYFGDVIVGVFFFFIIGCEFFINYKVQFRFAKGEVALEPADLDEEEEKNASAQASV
jgi:simple sugar transport system permease protein